MYYMVGIRVEDVEETILLEDKYKRLADIPLGEIEKEWEKKGTPIEEVDIVDGFLPPEDK